MMFNGIERDIRKTFIMDEKGSMQSSQLVSKELIDDNLPFFPLERKHVRKRIMDAIQEI